MLISSLLVTTGCAGITHKKVRHRKPEINSRLKIKKPARSKKVFVAKPESRTLKPLKQNNPERSRSARKPSTVPHPDVELNTDFFKGFVTDGIQLVTSPVRWDSKDWLTAGLIGGTTVALGFLDETVREEVIDSPSQARKDFLKIGEIAGDGKYAAAYLSFFYLTGLLRDDEELQSTALLATESFLLSNAFTLTLKNLIGRERPSGSVDADNFKGPFQGGGVSFPSGHTTTAFSIATIFAKQYKRHVWVPPVAYTLATMTALSRVNDNVHWMSDVFFGAAVGYFTASALHKMHSNPKAARLMLRPMVSSTRQGIALDYQF